MYLNTVAHLYMYIHITQSPWFRVIYTISITYATFPRYLSNFNKENSTEKRSKHVIILLDPLRHTISITYATFPRYLSNFKQTNNQDDRGTREVLITFSHDRMYYYYKEETNPVIPYLIF